jgi:hypothetical protein
VISTRLLTLPAGVATPTGPIRRLLQHQRPHRAGADAPPPMLTLPVPKRSLRREDSGAGGAGSNLVGHTIKSPDKAKRSAACGRHQIQHQLRERLGSGTAPSQHRPARLLCVPLVASLGSVPLPPLAGPSRREQPRSTTLRLLPRQMQVERRELGALAHLAYLGPHCVAQRLHIRRCSPNPASQSEHLQVVPIIGSIHPGPVIQQSGTPSTCFPFLSRLK